MQKMGADERVFFLRTELDKSDRKVCKARMELAEINMVFAGARSSNTTTAEGASGQLPT